MSLLESLKRAGQTAYLNDDGESRQLRLLPGLTVDEMEQLRASIPCPLPTDVEETLRFSRGVSEVEHTEGTVDLSGLSISGQWLEDFAPRAVALAGDGCGNSWSVDLSPQSKTWGPVYFFCHDPPVIVYQFPSAAELLQELHRPPAQSDLGDVLRRWSQRIYQSDPMAIRYETAIQGDSELAHFATSLGAGFHFVDLRNPQPGDGFNWGRFGPETQILRHPQIPLVAVKIPVKKASWWRLLRSRLMS